MKKRTIKQSKIQEILKAHFENNLKQYLIAGIVFIIGIIIGVIFVNNTSDAQMGELTEYLNNSITNINTNQIDKLSYIREACIENVAIIVILWFIGLTIIGIIINYMILAFKGFCIGYTISAMICTLGRWQGTGFVFISMFLQNFLMVVAIIGVIVSGTKFFISVIKNMKKDNVVMEIVRHTVFSALMLGIAILSAFIEVYLSNELVRLTIKFWLK